MRSTTCATRSAAWCGEESIILLPDSVRFVFLSATIPNARDFASWIAKIHNQKVNVVYTEYRPVPLQHYLFPVGGDGLFLVIDDKGNFREQNFSKALAGLGMNTLEMQVNEDKKKRPKKPTEDLAAYRDAGDGAELGSCDRFQLLEEGLRELRAADGEDGLHLRGREEADRRRAFGGWFSRRFTRTRSPR